MAKVKNVIKGCNTEYGKIEEIMIQNKATGKIIFWGNAEGFHTGGASEAYKKKVIESEVVEKQVFNSRKLHLLIDFE